MEQATLHIDMIKLIEKLEYIAVMWQNRRVVKLNSKHRTSKGRDTTINYNKRDLYILIIYIKVSIYFLFFQVNNQGIHRSNLPILSASYNRLPAPYFHIARRCFDSYSDLTQALIAIYCVLYVTASNEIPFNIFFSDKIL